MLDVLVLLSFELTSSVSLIYQLVLVLVLVSEIPSSDPAPRKQEKEVVPLSVLSEN